MVGRVDPFVLSSVLAEGGHGEIWEAVQVSLGRVVAVKRVREKWYRETDAATLKLLELAFHKEALITGRLDHPTIVPIYDLGADAEGRPLLAMKLVEGTVWTELINSDRRALEPAEFLAKHLRILVSTAQAVAFAHSRGVIHRDLKPSQVMVGEFGEVFLMDWGLAVVFDDETASAISATLPYPVTVRSAINPAGTIAYMAPEQTEKSPARLGPWTDIYLLGGMLYSLLTGTTPHNQPTQPEQIASARRGDYEPPEQRTPQAFVPPELSRICARAMQPGIGDRHPAVEDFIRAIEDYLTGTSRRAEAAALLEQARALTLHMGGAQPEGIPPHGTDEGRIRGGERRAAARTASAARYRDFSKADNLLTRVRQLWPEAPEAPAMQERLLTDFAGAALDSGDLGLARAVTGRLTDADTRASLTARVDDAARARRARARERRLAIAACFVLVVALAGISYALVRIEAHFEADDFRQKQEAIAWEIELKEARRVAAEEKQRRDLAGRVSALYADEAGLSRDLGIALRDELVFPPTLAFSPYDRQFLAKLGDDARAGFRTRLAAVAATRDSLTQTSATLAPPPPEMLRAAGMLSLLEAGTTGSTAAAYDLFARARADAAEPYRAEAGMALAAYRAGDLTSATELLTTAGASARSQHGLRSDFQKATILRAQALRELWSDIALGPDDILIEPREDGRNHDRHVETAGKWEDTDKPIEWAKSVAPGTTTDTMWGSRKVRFITPRDRATSVSFPIAARYYPRVTRPGRRYAYATWANSANAAPVSYRIVHAGGETTMSLAQDGWSSDGGNAHYWTYLGPYDFAPGDSHFVEMSIGPDVRAVDASWNGQVNADAVLFATKPLARCVVMPTAAQPGIRWHNDLSRAAEEATATARLIFAFVGSTGEPVTAYCDTHVFSDAKVARRIAGDFVALRTANTGDTPLNSRLRQAGVPSGTALILDADGNTTATIATADVASTATLLKELDRIAGPGGAK